MFFHGNAKIAWFKIEKEMERTEFELEPCLLTFVPCKTPSKFTVHLLPNAVME